MKAIILARVSTEEQREAGNSLPAQIERMKNYCERKNFEIIETFSFDESAYKTKRDEFDKVLEYLEAVKEKVALCFDKVDRFSRNVFDKRVGLLAQKAELGEIELHFVSDSQIIDSSMSASGKFNFGISLGAAKYYSDAISDNVKRVFEQKRRSGGYTGKCPIGYKNIALNEEKRLRKDIIIDPERGHLITALFELYSTGNYSISTLWQKMTEMGLRNDEGKPVARSHIDHTLHKTFYYGIARSKKYGSYPHNYPRLIDKELFDKCQEVRKGRNNKPSKEADTKPFMFRGLLTCQDCGCLMTPEIKKGKFIYYSCTNAKGNCQRVYVPEKTLLKPIYEDFEAFSRIPRAVQERIVSELRKLNEHEVEFHQKEVGRIQGEYARLQGKLDRLMDLLLDQSITKDEHDKKLQQLKDQQYRISVELDEYTKADHQYHIHVSTVINLSRNMKEIFESSELLEKRAILNYLLQNPTVSGKTLHYTLRNPFNTVLELANRPSLLRG